MSILLTTSQAAELKGVSKQTVRNWCRDKILGCQRTAGGHLRIDSDELDSVTSDHGSCTGRAPRYAGGFEIRWAG